MRRLMVIDRTSVTPWGQGPDGRVEWRQGPQLNLHGAFFDPNETNYRIGAPVEVRRGDHGLLSSRIMSLMFCSRLGTPPQPGFLGLPDAPADPLEPGDEVWIGERTQDDMHRAFVDWSVKAPRQPADDASLDRLEAELQTVLPLPYRRFMTRYGAGPYNVMPLDDTSWYCDYDARGDAPLHFLTPQQAIDATNAYWLNGIPKEIIVLFEFGGNWGYRSLVGMARSDHRCDDLPLMAFEFPYLFPMWPRPFASSFDAFLSGVLDACFEKAVPFTYDRRYYFTEVNRLELGREALAWLGPHSNMFRYWIELPAGKRFRFELSCDQADLIVTLQMRRPNGKPTLDSSTLKEWQGNQNSLIFDSEEGGFFEFDGGARERVYRNNQPYCLVRLKVIGNESPSAK